MGSDAGPVDFPALTAAKILPHREIQPFAPCKVNKELIRWGGGNGESLGIKDFSVRTNPGPIDIIIERVLSVRLPEHQISFLVPGDGRIFFFFFMQGRDPDFSLLETYGFVKRSRFFLLGVF